MSRIRLVALTAVVVLATVACSSSASSAPSVAPSVGPSTAGPAAAGDAVSISGFAFQPPSLTVAVGGTVTWTNSDSTGHTVTADDGSFKSDTLPSGATFSQTFATAGTFAYHCSIHPSMTGTITVH